MSRRRLPGAAAYLPALVLGAIGFVSGIAESSPISIALGTALALLALGALCASQPARLLVAGSLVAVLLALIAYHAYGLLSAGGSECGCLKAVGNPHRAAVLMVLSVALLSSGLRLSREVSDPPVRGVAGFLGLLVLLAVASGLLIAWSQGPSTLDGQSGPLVPQPGNRFDSDRPVLTGLEAHARPSGHLPVDQVPERPGLDWVIELIPPASSRPDTVAALLRTLAGGWERTTRSFVGVDSSDRLELALSREEWPTRPAEIGVEASGFAIQILPIEWQPDPSVRGRVRLAGGEELVGTVVDGVGAPVSGVELVLSDTFKFPGLWDETRRVSAAADGRELARVRSDEQGRFRMAGWAGDRAYVASADPAWRVLRRSDDPYAPIAGTGVHREMRVAVGRVALALLRVSGPHPEQAAWVEPVWFGSVDRRMPGAVEQSHGFLFGDLEIPLDSGVHACQRAVVLDASVRFEGRPAGTVVIRAPGCVDQSVSLVWSTPHQPIAAVCELQPRVAGPPTRVTLKLTTSIDGFTSAAVARVRLTDPESEQSYIMSFLLAGDGTRLESAVALPRGRYRVQSPLFSGDVVVENGGAEVSVEPVAFHTIFVDLGDAARKFASVTFTTARFSTDPLKTVDGDGYFGLNFALAERTQTWGRYAFPLVEDDVRIWATGPGWKAATGLVSIRSAGASSLRIGEDGSISTLSSGR